MNTLKKTVMNNISVLDNFYSNPQQIVSMLNGDYPIFGCGTGNRSIGLQDLDKNLYNDFCNAIYQIHNIPSSPNIQTFTFFMEHTYNPIEIFNHGWVHIDGKNPDVCRMTTDNYKMIVCGQIFLTPDPDPETGVSICDLKTSVNWTEQELIDNTVNDYTLPREKYLSGSITLEEYEEQHRSYHDNFVETCFVKNKYNRMVSWRGGSLHGSKMTKKMQKRLNQYFFVEYI